VPTRAVQFTILSIIALGYKSDVTPYVSELSSILLPVSKSATIDKTLFFESSTGNQRNGMYDIIGLSVLVFSCDVGINAGFAKDIETTISGISSMLINTVKLASRYC